MGLFDFFKKKTPPKAPSTEIYAPMDGVSVDLTTVDDPVFSAEMMGKGIAFQATQGTVCSPIAGKVASIFPTNHAIALETSDGLELLVHIGIDTVNLDGEGFQALVEPGQTVEVGTPLVEVDWTILEAKEYDPIIMLVVTNTQAEQVFDPIHGEMTKGDLILTVNH